MFRERQVLRFQDSGTEAFGFPLISSSEAHSYFAQELWGYVRAFLPTLEKIRNDAAEGRLAGGRLVPVLGRSLALEYRLPVPSARANGHAPNYTEVLRFESSRSNRVLICILTTQEAGKTKIRQLSLAKRKGGLVRCRYVSPQRKTYFCEGFLDKSTAERVWGGEHGEDSPSVLEAMRGGASYFYDPVLTLYSRSQRERAERRAERKE